MTEEEAMKRLAELECMVTYLESFFCSLPDGLSLVDAITGLEVKELIHQRLHWYTETYRPVETQEGRHRRLCDDSIIQRGT